MGNAAVQGRLWGAKPQDYAEYLEQVGLPLMGAALDAARVRRGTALLDAGCGAGLGALLADLRGASVAAIGASAGLLAIARERLPEADVREGDLEALPFAEATFDAVTAVNSVFYAADMAAAMGELVRVVLEGTIDAPPPEPVVDGLPRRKLAGQKPPGATTLQDVEDGVEDRP